MVPRHPRGHRIPPHSSTLGLVYLAGFGGLGARLAMPDIHQRHFGGGMVLTPVAAAERRLVVPVVR